MSEDPNPVIGPRECVEIRARVSHERELAFPADGARAKEEARVTHRVLKQGAQMVFWRCLSLGFGAAGSIWAARCLGPQNLGISGMIIATIAQAVLLIEMNLNTLLVRRYKECACETERFDLISTVFTFRLFLTFAMIMVAIVVVALVGIPPVWKVAVIAAFPLLLVTCNQAVWALQAQENMPANYKAAALPAVITAIIYFSIFRPGMGPGSDLVVQTIGFACSFIIGWHFATVGRLHMLLRPRLISRVGQLLRDGRWLMLGGAAIYVYVSLESPLLGYLKSVDELGKYRTATRLVAAAQSFLSMASLLLYPRLIEWNKRGREYLWQKQKRIAGGALLILAPLSLVTFLVSPLFYQFTYGAPFQAAALPFAILLTSKFVVVINSVFSFGLWAQKEDKKLTILLSATAATSLLLNILLIPRFGMLAAASVNLVSETVILFATLLITHFNKIRNFPNANDL